MTFTRLALTGLLLIIPPMLWAAATFVDDKLLRGDEGKPESKASPGTLLAIGVVFNLLVILLLGGWLYVNGKSMVGLKLALPIIANGALTTAAMWLYLRALESEGEVSRVLPWFQTVPMFGIVGAFVFLKEIPTVIQIGGIFLLVAGGFILSVKNGVVKHKLMTMMLLSSLLLAISDVVLAKFGRQADNSLSALFADSVGKAFWGSLFLISKDCRKGFVVGLKTKFTLQSISEILTIGANFIFDWGKLLVPVAIVQATACSAPLFGLAAVVFFTVFFPRILKEDLGGSLWQKVSGTVLIVGGGLIITVL